MSVSGTPMSNQRKGSTLNGKIRIAGASLAVAGLLATTAATPANAGRFKSAPAPSGSVSASTTKLLWNISRDKGGGHPKLKYFSTKARADAGKPNYVAASHARVTLRYSIDRSPEPYGTYWKTVYNGSSTVLCFDDSYHLLPMSFRVSPKIYVLLQWNKCDIPGTLPAGTLNAGRKVTKMVYYGDAKAKYKNTPLGNG
jgi:hypothetical protein